MVPRILYGFANRNRFQRVENSLTLAHVGDQSSSPTAIQAAGSSEKRFLVLNRHTFFCVCEDPNTVPRRAERHSARFALSLDTVAQQVPRPSMAW